MGGWQGPNHLGHLLLPSPGPPGGSWISTEQLGHRPVPVCNDCMQVTVQPAPQACLLLKFFLGLWFFHSAWESHFIPNKVQGIWAPSETMGETLWKRGWEETVGTPAWRPHCGRMNVGVAHSEVNPNTRVMNSRGIWLAYVILVVLLHVVLLSIPFFSIPVVWTLTNVIHNLAMYIFLHTVKGTPFETPDQGKARLLTHWEQMDYGLQFTSSRKFLSISPIVLYLLASFYTKYDAAHFFINTISLLSVLLPKLPQFHGVRLFGINKYWGVGLESFAGVGKALEQRAISILPFFSILFSVPWKPLNYTIFPKLLGREEIGKWAPWSSPAKGIFLWIRKGGWG